MLKQRNGWWHIHIPVRGKKPIRQATGIRVEGPKAPPEAQELHDKIANESWRVSRLGEKPSRSWEEAVIRWEKEMRERKRSLGDDLDKFKWLHPWLGGKRLKEITRDFWNQVLEAKRLEGVKDSTLNRYTALISAVMRKAERDWEWIDRAPTFRKLQEPEPRDRWLTPDEATGIVQRLPEWAVDPFLFDLATGLRCANLLGLRWNWIKGNAIEIPASAFKQKRKHPVPLTPFARSILTRQIGKHQEFVFVREGAPIRYDQWRRAWDKAKPEDVQFRDVRRTWATWLRDLEADERNVQDAGGWSTTDMLRRVYAVANAEKLVVEVSRLDPVLAQIRRMPADGGLVKAS